MASHEGLRTTDPIHAIVDAATRCLVTQHAGTCGVILGGSVARGEARPDSDIDLLVIDSTDGLPRYIRFYLDERAIDVRTVSAWEVQRLEYRCDESVVEWFLDTWVGDQFISHDILHWNLPEGTLIALENLLGCRASPSVVRSMELSLLERVLIDARGARRELQDGFLLECRQTLRRSLQWLLARRLLSAGQFLKSAKRRVEQVEALGSQGGPCLSGLISGLVGLDAIGGARNALELSRMRYDWRARFLEEVMRLTPSLNDPWIERNVHATDEYCWAIREGAWRGAVNHLRCLSGLHHDAARLSSALGAVSEECLSAFVADSRINRTLRENWLTLLGGEPLQSTLSAQIDAVEEIIVSEESLT